jgi:MGT family glycosyltransferase
VWEFLRPCDDRNVVFLPRQFQLHADDFDYRHAFVGPCRPPTPEAKGWLDASDDRPLVLISLGTTFNRNADFFRRCAAAFAGLSWRVVITLGSAGVDPAELSDLTGVEVYRWAPHTVLLPRASVFVCHGGMGSMLEALSFGTPLVLVPPDITEHRINARRAAELGLGRVLPFDTMTPGDLRDAVLRVAADEGVRVRVADMRRHVAEAGGAERAADVLEAAMTGSPV